MSKVAPAKKLSGTLRCRRQLGLRREAVSIHSDRAVRWTDHPTWAKSHRIVWQLAGSDGAIGFSDREAQYSNRIWNGRTIPAKEQRPAVTDAERPGSAFP